VFIKTLKTLEECNSDACKHTRSIEMYIEASEEPFGYIQNYDKPLLDLQTKSFIATRMLLYTERGIDVEKFKNGEVEFDIKVGMKKQANGGKLWIIEFERCKVVNIGYFLKAGAEFAVMENVAIEYKEAKNWSREEKTNGN